MGPEVNLCQTNSNALMPTRIEPVTVCQLTSVPHTPTYEMRIMTSWGSSMTGLSRTSNLVFPGPYTRQDKLFFTLYQTNVDCPAERRAVPTS